MGYEVHLSRFTDELLKEIPITREDWLECVQQIEGIKLVEGISTFDSIDTYSEQYKQWIPVFWIREDGSGFMRASGFFGGNVSYERGIEIATHLNAFIYGDEGEIFFLPGYGIVYDDVERENPEIYLEDLRRFKPQLGNDYEKIITAVEQEKLRQHRQQKIVRNTIEKNSSKLKWQNNTFIVFAVLLGIILIMYLIIKV